MGVDPEWVNSTYSPLDDYDDGEPVPGDPKFIPE
jgi:hypothetical protein